MFYALSLKIDFVFANSANPDEMPQIVALHLVLLMINIHVDKHHTHVYVCIYDQRDMILSPWPRCLILKINAEQCMDIDPKDRQTLFSKRHNISYSLSYLTVYSHSTTWWVNHACP